MTSMVHRDATAHVAKYECNCTKVDGNTSKEQRFSSCRLNK